VHPTLITPELQTIKCIKQHNINYQKGSLSLFSYLRDDYHKQAVLISETRSDSNRYTPCRGKPNQHVTRIPHSVRVWSQTIRISCGQCIATFCKIVNIFVQIHCPREEGLPTQSTARQPSDPWVRTYFLSLTTTNEAMGKR
jgi:hypothetical protein